MTTKDYEFKANINKMSKFCHGFDTKVDSNEADYITTFREEGITSDVYRFYKPNSTVVINYKTNQEKVSIKISAKTEKDADCIKKQLENLVKNLSIKEVKE